MSGRERGRTPAALAPRFRTLGVTTCWSAEQVRAVLGLLDELRAEIETVYGDELAGAYHEDECAAAAAAQQDLELDEPPF